MNQAYYTLKIKSIKEETFDAKSFVLEDVAGQILSYRPGQFLTLLFPKAMQEDRRSYSISSNPLLNEPLTITVKRIDNGEFSRYLFDRCRVGDLLYTIGASGYFTLPEEVDTLKQVFFFAAGSGITPILPLIKTLLYKHPQVKVYLVYSNRSNESTIFLNDILLLQKKFESSFIVELLFSSAKNLLKARLSKLILSQYLSRWIPQTKEGNLFYVCGPDDYMQMVGITLLTEGVNGEHIRKEIFNTVKPPIRELPPDQQMHHVSIIYREELYDLKVQYPTTILAAARERDILLPYSCEAGKCGTCSATCTQGKVWMSYNEVLLDKELNNGRILTCVGYPVGGDVELTFNS